MAKDPLRTVALPYPRSATLRDDTILRLGGDGGWYSMTWASDDRQLVAVCDGAGWAPAARERYFSSGLFALDGEPNEAAFHDLPTYPQIPLWDLIRGATPPYYCMSTLAIERCLYQFLSTFNRPFDHDYFPFNGAKLIYSPDNGRTWRNQDGSTPVVREAQDEQSRANLAFHAEPQNAFSVLSFVQMGQAYRENQDGYAYVYSPNGVTDGTMNELVMFRMPKARVLDRAAYEYFAGWTAERAPRWTSDIEARAVVHTFPRGWILSKSFPYAWHPSVVYNAPLGLYMMANWGSGMVDDVRDLHVKPSYLGLWIADQPWGPWHQILEQTQWLPAGEPGTCAARPTIAPKWIARDGRSFWLAWTDFQRTSEFPATGTLDVLHAKTEAAFVQARREWRESHAYFGFNAQRIDLATA